MKKLIDECRASHSRIKTKNYSDRIAVIVNTNGRLGVQFWTEPMITRAEVSGTPETNTDRTLSYLIERL